MQSNLVQLFQIFINTSYYQSSYEFDLEWIREKLDQDDYIELENQILSIIFDNDLSLFINTLKYAWQIFMELSSDVVS